MTLAHEDLLLIIPRVIIEVSDVKHELMLALFLLHLEFARAKRLKALTLTKQHAACMHLKSKERDETCRVVRRDTV
jgi:hypothetical protein